MTARRARFVSGVLLLGGSLLAAGCGGREEPELAPPLPAPEEQAVAEPAAPTAPTAPTTPVRTAAAEPDPAEGKKLYMKWGCYGCHGTEGEGGMGPSLVDPVWAYGSSFDDIYESIHAGRPNGMPGWGDRLSEQEIRHMVAYVESLSEG